MRSQCVSADRSKRQHISGPTSNSSSSSSSSNVSNWQQQAGQKRGRKGLRSPPSRRTPCARSEARRVETEVVVASTAAAHHRRHSHHRQARAWSETNPPRLRPLFPMPIMLSFPFPNTKQTHSLVHSVVRLAAFTRSLIRPFPAAAGGAHETLGGHCVCASVRPCSLPGPSFTAERLVADLGQDHHKVWKERALVKRCAKGHLENEPHCSTLTTAGSEDAAMALRQVRCWCWCWCWCCCCCCYETLLPPFFLARRSSPAPSSFVFPPLAFTVISSCSTYVACVRACAPARLSWINPCEQLRSHECFKGPGRRLEYMRRTQ